MEEIEVSSWLMLDAVRKSSEIIETVGNLQTGNGMSVFCVIEEDFLELCYSDAATNSLRRYDDREEFQAALDQRKEDSGDARYAEEPDLDEDFEDDDEDENDQGDGFHVEEELEDY